MAHQEGLMGPGWNMVKTLRLLVTVNFPDQYVSEYVSFVVPYGPLPNNKYARIV